MIQLPADKANRTLWPLRAGVAVLLLLLAFGSDRSYRSVERTLADRRWVAHTDSVIFGLEVLLATVKDAEVAHSDRLLIPGATDGQTSLAYAQQVARQQLARLELLLHDNPVQLHRLAGVDSLIDERMDVVRQAALNAGAEPGKSAVLDAARVRERWMRAFEDRVGAMQRAEQVLLWERSARGDVSLQVTLRTIALAGGAAILLALLLVHLSLRRAGTEKTYRRIVETQRERLRITLASIGDAVITTDADGRVKYMNAVAEKLTGWSEADAAGRPLVDIFHIVNETTRRPVENPALRALKEGRIVGLANHTILIGKDGTEVHIDDSAAPIRDNEGVLVGCVLIFRDIGEQRKAERMLHEQDVLIRAALHAADMGSWSMDPTTRTFRADERYERIVGAPVNGLTVDGGVNNLHPDDRARVKEAVAAALRPDDPAPYSEEYRVVQPDGTVRWIHSKGSATFVDDEGERRLSAFAGTVHDITSRKATEEALVASENFNRVVLESSPDCLKVLDLDGNLVRMNVNGLRRMEIDDFEPLKGKAWCDLWPEQDRATVLGSIVQARAQGTGGFVRQCPTAKGNWKWWDVSVSPIQDSTGVITGYVSVSRDITERRQDEEKLRKMADDLNENDRRKDEFLAMLAHELRNPLAPIRSGIELMDTADAATRHTLMLMMRRQVGQMVRLVDDLLDVSRVSRGTIVLRKQPVHLVDVLQQAMEASAPAMKAMAQELEADLAGADVIIEGDPARLAQVVGNLLTNASKFSDRNTRIALSARVEGPDVVVRVKDQGIGIAAEHLPRIFDLFAQVDSSVERSTGGLGIGLTLVKDLVRLQGGTVQAESPGLGQGSTFTVRLPYVARTATTEGPAPRKPAAATIRRVLVVDDNRDAADLQALVLSARGHTVRCAYTGTEALAVAEAFRPDIVLLDIGLPGLNGYEVAQRIREQPWGDDMCLVALTGWGQDEDKQRSAEAGFDHHLVKPPENEEVLRVIETLPCRKR